MPSLRHDRAWWESRLEGIERTADGFKALCPSHADSRPSLHVTDKGGADKVPVLHCFSGCDYTEIERAAREADPVAPSGPRNIRRRRTEAAHEVTATIVEDPKAWFAQYLGIDDAAFLGTLPLTFSKEQISFTFPHNGIAKQRVPGSKQFTWNKPGVFTPYLWPMPEDELPATIVLTEGETDCIILRYLGHAAYAITHGANTQLPPPIFALLRQRGVSTLVLAFDQDKAGISATEEYAEGAIAAGLSVSTLRPALRLFEGEKDIRDWYLRTKGNEPLDPQADAGALDLEALAALMPSTKVGWICQGYFAREAVTLVAGPPKSGKTSLVATFLSAQEQGASFLGFPTHPGRAIWMTEEFGPTILEKAQQFDLKQVLVLSQGDATRRGWDFGDTLSHLVAQAQQIGATVLVIDTLSAWAQFNDENDAAEITKAMSLIRNIASGSGLCIIVIHHTKKGGGEYGEAVRGSSALFAQADILLEYQHRGKGYRAVSVLSRYAHPPDEVLVRMTPDGRLEVVDQGEQRIEEAGPILEALSKEPLDKQGIMLLTGMSDTKVRAYLADLVRLGKVEEIIGKQGKKTYALVGSVAGGAELRVNLRRHDA